MVRRPLCILCFIFLTVVTLFMVSAPPPEQEEPRQVTAVGEIYYRENGTNSSIFYLKDTYLSDGSRLEEPKHLIIYLSKNIDYPIGTILKTKGILYPLETSANPGQFDSAAYYQAKGVDYRMQAKQAEIILKGPGSFGAWLREYLLDWKEEFCQRLFRLFTPEAAGVLQAMLFGVTTAVPEEIEAGYQMLGIGHLLAVSGLHITLLGGTVYKGSRRLGIPFVLSGVLAGIFLFCYQEMLGFRCSALRAVLMFLVFLGAQVAGRAYDRLTALALSMAILAGFQPMLVCTGGFWLSLSATLGAVVGLEQKEAARRQGKNGRWRDGIVVVFCIQILTLPLQLFFYYEAAVYGVFWNLLLVPLAGLVLGGGILALICSFVWFPAGVFAGGMAELVLLLYQMSGSLGKQLPEALYITGKPELWQVFVYYICLGMWFRRNWPGGNWSEKRKQNAASFWVGVCLAAAFVNVVFVRFHAPLEISFLDVGQGDCAVVREDHGLCMLIDGGSSDVDNVWEYRILPFLKYHKIPELDYVFASHGDTDHISGLLELFVRGEIPVRYLVCYSGASEKLEELKTAAEKRGTKILELHAGKVMRSETITITCLGPKAETGALSMLENDQSLVLLLESRETRFLFTGDMEEKEEREVLGSDWREVLNADVLKVSHHGSGTSSSEELLEMVSPVLSVISCGKGNSYGHPHEETLERLETVGSDIMTTMDCGAVTVKVQNGKVTAEGWKQQNGY